MKNLYEVTLERTTYQGEKSVETTQVWAKDKKSINTYRLGGFQRDSIKIQKAKKIRKQNPIELDVDLERNEISPRISTEAHIENTLEKCEVLTNMIKLYCKNNDMSTEDALEALGYHEISADNTYNYSSDFQDDLNFKVYSQNEKSDPMYGKDLIVLVEEHVGLDVRGGYRELGLFKGLEYDGLAYFYEMHVRVTIESLDDKIQHDFDGDWAFGLMLEQYKIKSWDAKKQKLVVTKDNIDYKVNWYHPAEGV